MNGRELALNLAIRLGRAALMGFLTYIAFYVLPMYFLGQAIRGLSGVITSGGPSPEALLVYFATMAVFFAVAIELTRDTVLEHAFSIGRGLAFLFFVIYATGGGLLTLTLSRMGVPIEMTIDASRLVLILVGIGLLDVGRSILNAVNWACEKAERELVRQD